MTIINFVQKWNHRGQAGFGGWLLEFYVLATFNISGWVPTYDSMHSSWLYSAAPLRDQATITMTWYPTESHYPDTEPTSPCPILKLPSTRLGSYNYQLYKSLLWLDDGFEPTIYRAISIDSPTRPVIESCQWDKMKVDAFELGVLMLLSRRVYLAGLM